MRSQCIALTVAGIAAGLGTAAVHAHHAFAAEFDREQPVELIGTITKVDWTNPHARFYIDAPDPNQNGEVVNWNFELGSPNGLMRQGWRRETLSIGDTITVTGWRARNAPHVANAGSVTDSTGRCLFAGSSNDEAAPCRSPGGRAGGAAPGAGGGAVNAPATGGGASGSGN
jgi:Family of unknown function (DUF6152)